MTKFDDLKTRVRLLLDDSAGDRFSDDLLGTAMRLALDEVDHRLPCLESAEVVIATGGREQALSGLNRFLALVSLSWPSAAEGTRELEPETQFTCFLKAGVPTLRFTGETYPQAGDTLSIRYAAGHTIQGLEGASTTTLPVAYEGALVTGTAGKVCLLRAAGLAERFGSQPAESARLLELSALWLGSFTRALQGLTGMQEFSFPPGFALDRWDRVRS